MDQQKGSKENNEQEDKGQEVKREIKVNKGYHNILGRLIQLIHIALTVFVLVVPFVTGNVMLLALHTVTCTSLLLHWYTNSDICSMSILEAMLRGVPYTETWIHGIVRSVYSGPSGEYSKGVWAVTICLGAVSALKILKSDKIPRFLASLDIKDLA